MLWIIILLVIVIISFLLAVRSMKNYQEIPTTKYPYGVFLIRNEQLITLNGTLNNLYNFCTESNAIIAIERLIKGSQKALVLFAPLNVGQFVPELELLEIEDYIEKDPKGQPKKVSANEVVIWSYNPKNESEFKIPETFLKEFTVDDNQQVFWQLVLAATKKDNHFQINIRSMVAENDVHKRIQLAKKFDEYISTSIGMTKKNSPFSIGVLFDEYKKRTIIPAEVEGFVISTQTIKQLF